MGVLFTKSLYFYLFLNILRMFATSYSWSFLWSTKTLPKSLLLLSMISLISDKFFYRTLLRCLYLARPLFGLAPLTINLSNFWWIAKAFSASESVMLLKCSELYTIGSFICIYCFYCVGFLNEASLSDLFRYLNLYKAIFLVPF